MSVRETLEARLRDMRRSEVQVARRLRRNLGLVAEKTLREVAAACHTSDATVVRACRAAGFDGFQDLKYYVLRELTSGEPKILPEQHGTYNADITATISAAEDVLDEASDLFRSANRVALVGVGASQGVALIATDILFTLRKQALFIDNPQMAAFAFTPPVDGLVLLAISHSGETQFTLRVVAEAREARVPSIGLTNEPASDLARAVDVLLATQAAEPAQGSYAIGPRICQLAMLDLLFARVRAEVMAKGPGTASRGRSTRASK